MESMNDKRLNKVTEAIWRKFPDASIESAREFAMALIDYGQRIRKQLKRKPFKGKEIKLFLQKKGGK